MKNLTSALIIALLAASAPAATIYVDANGTGDHSTIQTAIDNAGNGDQIVLLPGTYTGPGNRDIDYKGKAITVRSTDPNNWGVVELTVIDLEGYEGVRFHNSEDANSVLTGLTIESGWAFYKLVKIPVGTEWPPTYKNKYIFYGGAIACEDASPTISRCILTQNGYRAASWSPDATQAGQGGAIYCSSGEPLISECIIKDNQSNEGGAVYFGTNQGKMERCLMVNNIADHGGAVCARTVNLESCTIEQNAANEGAAAYCTKGTIKGCRISHNTVYAGAVVQGTSSMPLQIVNSLFIGNTAYGTGPVYISPPPPSNGAIVRAQKFTKLTNCTIYGNRVAYGYILDFIGSSSLSTGPEIKNCIIQRNIYSGDYELINTNANISYSNIQGGWEGEGNIDQGPCCTHDGYLIASSSCIDAGTDVNAPDSDINGEARPYGAAVDIGADEFIDTDGDGLPDWWEHAYTGNNTAAPSRADWDADGWSNADEYRCGTEPNAAPLTFYVNGNDGNDVFDGSAPGWNGLHGPKKTIQAAINMCADRLNDRVIVAPGTYTGEGNRNLRFFGKAITVRSTNPQDPCTVDATGIDCLGHNYRGFIFDNFESPASVVCGLTLRDANAFAPAPPPPPSPPGYYDPDTISFVGDQAGAVISICSNPVIANCSFEGNSGDYAGAIYCIAGDIEVRNCRFVGNTAELSPLSRSTYSLSGGAVYAQNCNLNLSDSTFENNTWGYRGAVVSVVSSDATIKGCLLK